MHTVMHFHRKPFEHFVSFLSMVKVLLGECLANSQGSWVIVVCIFLKKRKDRIEM